MISIKKIFSYTIAPFKDKMKMQRRINTLENDNEMLHQLFENEFQKAMDTLMNIEELEKLRKENKHLRLKVKVLRSNKK